MCRCASLVVTKNEEVYAYPGVDSHSRIITLAGIKDDKDYRDPDFAYVEIIPVEGKPPAFVVCSSNNDY